MDEKVNARTRREHNARRRTKEGGATQGESDGSISGMEEEGIL